MCLGVPGKIVEVFEREGLRLGTVDFAGVRRSACLEYVPEATVGSYVVVHVGFAISTVDEQEALRAYELLEELGNLEGVNEPQQWDRPFAPDGGERA